MYHPRADIERLDTKRENGGRSLIELQNNHNRIKEMLGPDNRLDATVIKQTRSKRKNIQLVKKVINLQINSTSH